MKVIVVLSCVIFQLAVVNSRVLPGYLTTPCAKKDPNYAACALKYIAEQLRPLAPTGLPFLGIPPWDPFTLAAVNVNINVSENTALTASLKNLKVTGLGNCKIDELKVDLDTLSGKIRKTFAAVHVETDHKIFGRLLGMPLDTRGSFEGNFTDVSMTYVGNLKVFRKKNGREYFQVDKLAVDYKFGGGQIKIISSAPEFQQAADAMSTIFNSNPKAVFDAVSPFMPEIAVPFIKQQINKYLFKIPADELLPEKDF